MDDNPSIINNMIKFFELQLKLQYHVCNYIQYLPNNNIQYVL